MRVKSYSLLVLFFIFFCNFSDKDQPEVLEEIAIYKQGQKFTSWFFTKELDSLIECIVDENYTINNLKDFRKKIDLQLGREINVLNEQIGRGKTKDNSDWHYYIRYSEYTKISRPVKTMFSFDNQNNIYRFSVESLPEEASTRFAGYQTKTELILPFKGRWFVAAGGRTINLNHHTVSPDQRFADDFLIRKGGFTYQNAGTKNEDYFCYDKQIFVPGSGVVVDVVDKFPENKPGEMPKTSGNRVIIDHGNGEYSVLSHFKKGSIVVKLNDTLKIGQYLGLCGNSGHSSEAHLHYQLQNSPIIFEGEGLPAQFQNYIAVGKKLELVSLFGDRQSKIRIDSF